MSRSLSHAALLATTILTGLSTAHAQNGQLPNGQFTTPSTVPGAVIQPMNPLLAPYPNFVASGAVRAQLSPDGSTLAVICAGQNSLDDANGRLDTANSTQYVFLYDVTGANQASPAVKQVLKQTNAHVGLVWSVDGATLFAGGGNDDAVYVYTKNGTGQFTQTKKIKLGHSAGVGSGVQPNASGLAISPDGSTLIAVNNYNDSISVIDVPSQTVRYEQDLRPSANGGTAGTPGGTYPLSVAFVSNGVAYVGAYRDREIDVVSVGLTSAKVTQRIALDGNPNGLVLSGDDQTLYVAQDNADQVAVISTATNTVVAKIDTRAPAGTLTGTYTGTAPFGLTLSPDGSTLYVANNGSNSIAVIPLTGASANKVSGLIPTAYSPRDVTISPDGATMYVINGKSNTGPNPGHLSSNTSRLTTVTYPGGNAATAAAANATNQYQFQLEKSFLMAAPVPTAAQLPALTAKVAQNNFYSAPSLNAADTATMKFLQNNIQHVIYIVKENRTFDQVLGDLGNGSNGAPNLTVFGKRITPNFHALAKNFVTIDNFFDAADGSMDGWSLATRGRVTTTEEIAQQINYAFVNRGLSYDTEGTNRGVPVGLSPSVRAAFGFGADVLAGPANVTSTDAPFGIQQGFIYNAVLNAGKTVRNYGFLTANIGSIGTVAAPIVTPYPATVQVAALDPNLLDKTDVYFRGYDQNYPDLWRFYEWQREFNGYVAGGNLPNFQTVRFSHDHMGFGASVLGGLTTPEAQQGDDDYAVGRLVQAVAQSPYAANTLIIITEDDTQDGGDHVDSHRATTYVVGPYVKKGAIISTRYNQVNVLRTIEDIFGTQHINLNTAYQRPMVEVFDTTQSPAWTFTATASTILKGTSVIVASAEGGQTRFAEGPTLRPKHSGAYWAHAFRGFDFSEADRVPQDLFNRVLWKGLMDGKRYPEHQTAVAGTQTATR